MDLPLWDPLKPTDSDYEMSTQAKKTKKIFKNGKAKHGGFLNRSSNERTRIIGLISILYGYCCWSLASAIP